MLPFWFTNAYLCVQHLVGLWGALALVNACIITFDQPPPIATTLLTRLFQLRRRALCYGTLQTSSETMVGSASHDWHKHAVFVDLG